MSCLNLTTMSMQISNSNLGLGLGHGSKVSSLGLGGQVSLKSLMVMKGETSSFSIMMFDIGRLENN